MRGVSCRRADGSAARKILLLFIFVNTGQGYLMSSNGVSDASKSTVCRIVAAVSPLVFESMTMNTKKMNYEMDITQQRFVPGVVLLNADKV